MLRTLNLDLEGYTQGACTEYFLNGNQSPLSSCTVGDAEVGMRTIAGCTCAQVRPSLQSTRVAKMHQCANPLSILTGSTRGARHTGSLESLETAKGGQRCTGRAGTAVEEGRAKGKREGQ